MQTTFWTTLFYRKLRGRSQERASQSNQSEVSKGLMSKTCFFPAALIHLFKLIIFSSKSMKMGINVNACIM